MPLKLRTFSPAPFRVHTELSSMPPGSPAGRSAASRNARLGLTGALQIAAIGVLTTATPAASHSLQEVEQQLFKRERYFQSVNQPAPEFTLRDAAGRVHRLRDYRGKVVILNFICTKCPDVCPLHSEKIAQIQKQTNISPMKDQVAFLTISTDPRNDTPIADPERKIAGLYGMIHPNANDTLTVRSVYVIGPDKKLKLTLTYPASTGRNFEEILRVIDSLQLTANHSVATPADWKSGEDVIIVPSLSDEQAREKFPGGWKTLKPYLRVVPEPQKAG